MKILFFGGTKGSSGPDHVNRRMVENLTERFRYVKSASRCLRAAEALEKCVFSDVTVVSGVSALGCMLMALAGLLGRKRVYIMHGCAAHEAKTDGLKNVDACLRQERYLLEHADLLLPVSEKFRDWVRSRYPRYAEKTKHLYNGIDKSPVLPSKKKAGSVMASGGGSRIKNNAVAAAAVESLSGELRLEICGSGLSEDTPNVRYLGQLSHEAFLEKLGETEIFVVNSIFESFSIAAVEALSCGCSLLISEAAGVTGLLTLEENDIIHDPMNAGEIKEKLLHLHTHPNNRRLLSGLDFERWSYAQSVARLEKLCADLIKCHE